MRRNKEIRRYVRICILSSIILIILGCIIDIRCGMYTAIVCAVFICAFFLCMKKRYDRMSDLSLMIDKILHGEEKVKFNRCQEGELAILENEISKMIIRLKEQSDQLLCDKTYLADSLADISHQIRTPLTSLNLITSLIRKPDISYEKRAELVAEMNRLLTHMEWLIEMLLKISKLDAGMVEFANEPVSVKDLLEESSRPFLIGMDLKNIQLQYENVENVTFVGDFNWTSEAVSNIIKNCMEHTPENGHIYLKAIENPLYVEIEIADTGTGVNEKDLPHLFERFYKGENATENSFGIGLALARMIMVRQNGTISAENRKEGGTAFHLRFYKGTV